MNDRIALAFTASISLSTLAGCASAPSVSDSSSAPSEDALVTTTSSAWSGVYDLKAAAQGRDAQGSLHIYSLNKSRLILAIHARATPTGKSPDDGQETIRIDVPVPVVGSDHATYAETTNDENMSPVPNPSGCKVDITRQGNGDNYRTARRMPGG